MRFVRSDWDWGLGIRDSIGDWGFDWGFGIRLGIRDSIGDSGFDRIPNPQSNPESPIESRIPNRIPNPQSNPESPIPNPSHSSRNASLRTKREALKAGYMRKRRVQPHQNHGPSA